MSRFQILGLFLVFTFSIFANAQNYSYQEPDFSINKPVPLGGNFNPFNLPSGQYEKAIEMGRRHAVLYPVDNTKFLPPTRPLKNFIEEDSNNPLKQIVKLVFREITSFKTVNDLFKWVGLHPYPAENDTGIYSVPYPNGQRPEYLMGYTPAKRYGVEAFTLSCVSCHSGTLFGKTIVGMTNRFPRAYEAFSLAHMGRNAFKEDFFINSGLANPQEAKLLAELGEALKSVGPKSPSALGLDVSISFTSRSLARREPDEWASLSKKYQENPRPDWHDNNVAESKPPVWWNVKYKNKWGPDGSFVSGNPVFTNILWNEIGRGADLKEFDKWMDANYDKYIELTTAVFSSEAPHWTDFFPAESINITRAKNGEKLFNQSCAGCHGHYVKGWSSSEAASMPLKDQLKTIQVLYPKNTPIVDVGTDAWRRKGTTAVERMNNLTIQKKYKTEFKTQSGYVPQPLVGIWARWPYFHNNSVPSLCAVLTKSKERPKFYYSGAAENPKTDFDKECNGYPVGKNTPKEWKQEMFLFNTTKKGLSNQGHDEGIFLANGKEIFTSDEKIDIIKFLQTL